jgi:nucleotide-binding universal stress UspA family protein
MTTDQPIPTTNIVVGFLPNDEGWAALRNGIAEAQLRNGRLLVIHSVHGENEDADDFIGFREALATAERTLTDAGVPFEIQELVRGKEPAQDLLDVARTSDADLIVIGIRQRSQIGKLLLGSNALAILHDAACPVLAVKADQA